MLSGHVVYYSLFGGIQGVPYASRVPALLPLASCFSMPLMVALPLLLAAKCGVLKLSILVSRLHITDIPVLILG